MQACRLHLGGATLDAAPLGLTELAAAHTRFFAAAALSHNLREGVNCPSLVTQVEC